MGNIWSPGGEWMTHVWLIRNPEGDFGRLEDVGASGDRRTAGWF